MATQKISELKGKPFRPYGTEKELDALVDSNIYSERYIAAVQNYGLDKLVSDPDWGVRAQVATNGYGINVLMNDPDEFVRAAVVRYLGQERRKDQREENIRILQRFINDESKVVRFALAQQGCELDTLMKDDDPFVRAGAAYRASDEQLAILISDEYPNVRIAVAERGYGVDALINDSNPYVSEAANRVKSEYEIRTKEKD